MKRWLMLAVAVLLTVSAGAEDISLRTMSCFAGDDAAAVSYVELLRAYEEQTGNVVEDDSATSDESWKARVLSEFAVGNEPDVLFFFARSADSRAILHRVVPIREIIEAYPEMNLAWSDALREEDGEVYAIPVRPYYEGLFVNTDLFEEYDQPLPDTWEHLEAAVQGFSAAGVVPIAVSLSDIPHYIAECAMLSCATPEEYAARPAAGEPVPESWKEGMARVRRLCELGAFPEDTLNTSEAITSQMFRDKRAAMQFDGSWFANTLSEGSMDTTAVLPVPSDGDCAAVIGGVSMGFYLTRRAWEDPRRREAAVALLAWLTKPGNASQLGNEQISGKLKASADRMLAEAKMLLSPVQDDMNKDARELWLLDCVPAVAEGRMSAEDCWARVMALDPFANVSEQEK